MVSPYTCILMHPTHIAIVICVRNCMFWICIMHRILINCCLYIYATFVCVFLYMIDVYTWFALCDISVCCLCFKFSVYMLLFILCPHLCSRVSSIEFWKTSRILSALLSITEVVIISDQVIVGTFWYMYSRYIFVLLLIRLVIFHYNARMCKRECVCP